MSYYTSVSSILISVQIYSMELASINKLGFFVCCNKLFLTHLKQLLILRLIVISWSDVICNIRTKITCGYFACPTLYTYIDINIEEIEVLQDIAQV